MSTSTANNAAVRTTRDARVLREGYGPGAWHGADLKAALADVEPALAFWRPAAGRHNIAEIALHHAYTTHGAREQISGQSAEPFVLDGQDWFDVSDGEALSWPAIRTTVESEQQKVLDLITGIERAKASSALSDDDRFSLVLGVTCHAVYHAGQIQLIKRLHGK